MEAEFESTFGLKPLYRIKCPGRVNLIGGSIDYNGYGVLPMAIGLSTEFLVTPIDQPKIELRNHEADKYHPFTMDLPSEWAGVSPPQWFDYVLCGWKGVLDVIHQPQKGMLILVKGTIPPSSGLSSSSSLVCAAALTTLTLHNRHGFTDDYPKIWLADLCSKAEQMIGTCGGGMDHASEILSTKGAALKIDFNPLRLRPIQLPENALFVVLHSGDTLNKAVSSHYNERVVECRITAQLLGKHLDLTDWNKIRRLKEVEEKTGKSLDELLELVVSVIPEKMTLDEVITLIGKENLNALLTENTRHMMVFKTRARALHCYEEVKRVTEFEEACQRGDLITMGQVMNESHESLKKNYENSSPGMEKLIDECRKAGVLGVRLTGAGWGGCAVALVDKKKPVDLSHLHVLFQSSPCEGITLEKL